MRPEQVEIEEAVVERRDQRIGQGMREARQRGVGARRVDHDEIAVGQLGQGRGQPVGLVVAPGDRAVRRRAFDRDVARQGQRHQHAGGRRLAVVDIAGEGALARVAVDRADLEAVMQQGDDQMHGGGRLARPALLVAQDDDMRPARVVRCHACELGGLSNPYCSVMKHRTAVWQACVVAGQGVDAVAAHEGGVGPDRTRPPPRPAAARRTASHG